MRGYQTKQAVQTTVGSALFSLRSCGDGPEEAFPLWLCHTTPQRHRGDGEKEPAVMEGGEEAGRDGSI